MTQTITKISSLWPRIRLIFIRLMFILLPIITLSGTGFLAFKNHNDFKRAMIGQLEQQLSVIAKSQAQSISSQLDNIKQSITVFSDQSEVKALLFGVSPDNGHILEPVYQNIKGLVDSVYLLDSLANVRALEPYNQKLMNTNFGQEPDVAKAREYKKNYTSGVLTLANNKRAISYVYPVFDADRVIGYVRVVLVLEKFNEMVRHINEQDNTYAFIIDSAGNLLSYPDIFYLGHNVFTELIPDIDAVSLKPVLEKMLQGQQGFSFLQFSPAGAKPQIAKTLLAFQPLPQQDNFWSLAVAVDYDAIAGPINKNFRNNLLLLIFLAGMFTIIGIIFHVIQEKRDKVEISMAAMKIINRQLHLELAQRRQVEEELNKYTGNRSNSNQNSSDPV